MIDKFLFAVGEGVNPRQYIIHTRMPRFIAEVLPSGDPDALTSQLAAVCDWSGETIAEFEFIDDPSGADLAALLLETIDAWHRYDIDTDNFNAQEAEDDHDHDPTPE